MKRYSWLLSTIAAMLLASIVMVTPLKGQESKEDITEEDSLNGSDSQAEQTILQTIADNTSLKTFGGFLEETGLTEMLKGDGPFTLFIPDDSAFAKLPEKDLERMEYSEKYARSVLLRHIVKDQAIVFGDVEKKSITTADGEEFEVVVTEDAVQIENAKVIEEDIECTNGVIHIIDAVIMPKKVEH
jgi:transforming growth factor-beta-induced protein